MPEIQYRIIKVEIADGRPVAYWPYLEIDNPNVDVNGFYVNRGNEFYLVTPVGAYVWAAEPRDHADIIHIVGHFGIPCNEPWRPYHTPKWMSDAMAEFGVGQ